MVCQGFPALLAPLSAFLIARAGHLLSTGKTFSRWGLSRGMDLTPANYYCNGLWETFGLIHMLVGNEASGSEDMKEGRPKSKVLRCV